MYTHVKNDASHSALNNRTVSVGANNETRVEGDHTLVTQGNSNTLTTGNRTEQAFASNTIAAGDTVRIECRLSAIELTKDGAINFIGKNFNITVDNNGEINTKGGQLHSNPEEGSAATIAPGSGHKDKIKNEIESYFSSSTKDNEG